MAQDQVDGAYMKAPLVGTASLVVHANELSISAALWVICRVLEKL